MTLYVSDCVINSLCVHGSEEFLALIHISKENCKCQKLKAAKEEKNALSTTPTALDWQSSKTRLDVRDVR